MSWPQQQPAPWQQAQAMQPAVQQPQPTAEAHAAAWAAYHAAQAAAAAGGVAAGTAAGAALGQQAIPAAVAPQASAATDAHAAAWAQYYAQQAAAQQAAAAQAAAAQAQAAAAQPDAAAAAAWAHRQAALSGPHADAWRAYYAAQAAQQTPQPTPQPQPQAQPVAAAPASYAAAVGASYSAAPASYNAVPPPAALQPLRPGGVPPPRPPAGPPPAAAAKRPPGIAAPYAVAAPRPAYIAPARPAAVAPAGAAPAGGAASGGGWPPALRAWVTRAFNSCADAATRAWMPEPLKACIDEATAKGELWTRDWDTTPVPRPPPSVSSSGGGGAGSGQQAQPPGAWGSASYAQAQAAARATQYGSYGAGSYDASYGAQQWPLPGARSPSSSPERARQDAWAAVRERRPALGSGAGRGRGGKRSRGFSDDAYGAPPPASTSARDWAEDAGKKARREGRFGDGRAEGAGSAANGSGATGTARRRALAAMQLAAAAEGGDAEPDWDALTIRGTCTKLEKSYFRLTSAPDPATVRPAPVLAAALAALQGAAEGSLKWLYVNDQCKALRQDLTVQRIRTPLAASVYEFHARAALAAGDLAEFNQCQTVLWGLHAELGAQADPACVAEFAAYRILYAAVMAATGSAGARALAAAARLPGARPPAVEHAAAVQRALVANDYIAFFRLLRTAPGRGAALMAPAVERVRFAAASVAARAYRPTLPLRALLPALGFDAPGEGGAPALHAWLLAHGAVVAAPPGGGDDVAEAEVDCKASAGALFVPAPENAVAHGDADLDVSDFLKAFAPPPPPPGEA